MTSQSAKELVGELNNHKVEVSKLRNALNELDKEKESWFKKKEEISAKIKQNINKIKDTKTKRDDLTKDVKGLKQVRDLLNEEKYSKLSEFTKLKKEKSEIFKSLDVKQPSSRIKEHIEKLEFKIETEALPFSKEQEIMKKIKELKKLYGESKILDESNKKIKEISTEVRNTGKEANYFHKSIQEKAKQSQNFHEEILKLSADIDKMKIEEEEAFKKFAEFKKKFREANSELKEKLKVMNDVKSQLDKIYEEKKEKKKQEQEYILKLKEEAVNEKIKRGEKLTTEDLLVFQKSEKI